jgi:hypothetical protein
MRSGGSQPARLWPPHAPSRSKATELETQRRTRRRLRNSGVLNGSCRLGLVYATCTRQALAIARPIDEATRARSRSRLRRRCSALRPTSRRPSLPRRNWTVALICARWAPSRISPGLGNVCVQRADRARYLRQHMHATHQPPRAEPPYARAISHRLQQPHRSSRVAQLRCIAPTPGRSPLNAIRYRGHLHVARVLAGLAQSRCPRAADQTDVLPRDDCGFGKRAARYFPPTRRLCHAAGDGHVRARLASCSADPSRQSSSTAGRRARRRSGAWREECAARSGMQPVSDWTSATPRTLRSR